MSVDSNSALGNKGAIEDCSLNKFTECIPPKLMRSLKQCIECGKCVGICTAARVSDFNSREIVKKVLEGDESVLSDENLWKCFLCHYCWMVCPKEDMDLPELIFRLREISIERGYAPDKLSSLTHWLSRFFENGKIAGPNKVSKQRIENIRNIAKISGVFVLEQRVKRLAEKKNNENNDKKGKMQKKDE
ncbi:MAG: 4Fe-4S dicluster domain-containing protein [Promethearchaeota archaeon]